MMINRRMGERVYPTDLTVAWCPPGTKIGARRASKQPKLARIVDISQTGAQAIAEADDRVQRGINVTVILADVPCEARVRWIGPTNVDGVAAYGIEFIGQSRAFTEAIVEVFRQCYAREGLALRPPPVERRTGW